MDAIPNGPRKKILQGSFDLVLKLPWNEAAGAPWSLLVFAKKKVVLKTLFFYLRWLHCLRWGHGSRDVLCQKRIGRGYRRRRHNCGRDSGTRCVLWRGMKSFVKLTNVSILTSRMRYTPNFFKQTISIPMKLQQQFSYFSLFFWHFSNQILCTLWSGVVLSLKSALGGWAEQSLLLGWK